MTKIGQWSPWGTICLIDHAMSRPDHGITFVQTPSHGGFKLTAEAMRKMPERMIDGADNSFRQQRRAGWFEEDCDAALVIAAFPDLFPADMVQRAIQSNNHWHPNTVTAEAQGFKIGGWY